MRTALACLAAGLLLALAAPAALAQNAGDQQYQDPLADDGGGGGGNGNGGGGNGSSGNGGGSGGGNTAPSTQTETAQANGDDAGAQDGLPRTGLDAWLLVIAGTAMLGGGFALRRVADRAGA